MIPLSLRVVTGGFTVHYVQYNIVQYNEGYSLPEIVVPMFVPAGGCAVDPLCAPHEVLRASLTANGATFISLENSVIFIKPVLHNLIVVGCTVAVV